MCMSMCMTMSYDTLRTYTSGPLAIARCRSLDTSCVTSMEEMFYSASAFNQPLSLDTSRVTEMRGMFTGASAFNQPLSFDTSRVTDMGAMFYYALSFNQPLSFDTSSVTHMVGMFGVRSRAPSALAI